MKGHFYPYSYEPGPELFSSIMASIHKEERKYALRNVSICSILSLGSLAGLIPMWMYLYNALEVSGFIQYISLIFSDWSLIIGHLGDYIFSLGESLPVVELSLFLLLAVVLIASSSYILNSFAKFRRMHVATKLAV